MEWVDLVRDIQFTNQVKSVPITVSVEGLADVETRGIWRRTMTASMPAGAEYTRRDPIRAMALRRDTVPSIPRGSVILAPEKPGGTIVGWVVDDFDRREAVNDCVILRRSCEHDPVTSD